MSRSTYHHLGSLLVALLVGGGLYWLAGNLGIALVAGLVWGSAVGITLRIARRYPDRTTGTAWADKRWTGLGAGLVSLAALVGVSPSLSLSEDLRFGLAILVLGAGFVSYSAATMAELEREPSSQARR